MDFSLKPHSPRYQALLSWSPIIIGLLWMYLPTFQYVSENLWNTDEQGHGLMIFIVVIYLIWQKREIFSSQADAKLQHTLGWLLLLVGVILFAIGRSQEILFFEIGSLIPVLSAILLLTKGLSAIKELWFPLFFILFMIPLPSVIVDALTNPLKYHISVLAESILYQLDYPIARTGVTISIGNYRLLVADACSGLHSIFSLSALGLIYLYMMQYRSLLRNGLILSSILPIAFIANLLRVIALILITYYFGDEVAQGFVHKFTGLFLFAIALTLFFGVDYLIGKISFFQDSHAK